MHGYSPATKLTTDVPHVSAFESSLGNTLKSTASIQITVMTIMCALYTVTHPFGLSLRSLRSSLSPSLPACGLSGGSMCGSGRRVAAQQRSRRKALNRRG